jgi:Mannosyltransferase (PIG-V)
MTVTSTLSAPVRRRRIDRLGAPRIASLESFPLLWAVLASRLLVLVGGIAGSSFGPRVSGWTQVDPARLSLSFGSAGNALLAGAVRWDAVSYLNIAQHGYSRAGETIYFPGYPLLISAIGTVTRSDVIAAVIISAASFAVGLWLLHRLTELELGVRAANATILLLAFAPVSFFFTAAYTESLFLALSVGAVYAARRERWALAGCLAAVATVTRVTGILLVVPIAVIYLRARRRPGPQLGWLLLAPASLVAFLAYMSARGYGWLAPFENQRAHRFAGPIATIAAAASGAWHGITTTLAGFQPLEPSLYGPLSSSFDSSVLLIVLVVAAAALVLVFRRLAPAYGLYAGLSLLVCIASQTMLQPLEGLDRYSLTIFPLWMAAGAWLSTRRALRPVVLLGAALLVFYTFEFTTWAFIA